MTPGAWPFVLLTLAAFRVFWLVSEDAILNRPRDWLTADGERETVLLFLTCGWCAGFWVSMGWWMAWVALDDWVVAAAVPFAISAVVGAVTMGLHRLADG